MKRIQNLLCAAILMLFVTTVSAQFDKASCTKILSGYTKENADFTKMNVATLDFTHHKQVFDIGWLTGFKFNFMDTVLDIEYTSSTGTFHTYIPYNGILKINASKGAVDIIIKN